MTGQYEPRPPIYQDQPRSKAPKRKRKRRISIGNIITKLVALILLVLLILVLILPSWKPYRDTLMESLVAGLEYYQEDPEFTDFKVERVLTITPTGGKIEYSLVVTPPQDIELMGREIQKVIAFETDPKPTRTVEENGESILYWNAETTSSIDIHLTYHIRSYTVEWDINARNSGEIEDIPKNYTNRYTGDRWIVFAEDGSTYRDVDNDNKTPDYRIEPSNQKIKAIAEDLADGEDNIYLIAYNIYQFLQKGGTAAGERYGFNGGGFAYPTPEQMENDRKRFHGKPKPAYMTLYDGYGDCDDQAILFISLCRSVGIPAWLQNGALYNQYSYDPNNAWEGHGWAKLLIPLDNGDLYQPVVDPVNHHFLKRDANRFSDWEDPGGPKHPDVEMAEMPPLPLDIESYYTSWTYRSSGGVQTEIDEYYITHFFDPHKNNLEIKV